MKAGKPATLVRYLIMAVLIVAAALPGLAAAEERDQETMETSQPITFPVKFKRATGDPMNNVATDGKGTIITLSDKFLNITRDYGKTWEARRLPSSEPYFEIDYLDGLYYITNDYRYSGEPHYYSSDGATWTPFYLKAPDGKKLGINNIQKVNEKWIAVTTNEKLDSLHIFTSKDGKEWARAGALTDILWSGSKVYIVPSGKGYAAIAGGHSYFNYKKTTVPNNFLTEPKGGEGADLIVYTSLDLEEWTLRSGAEGNFRYNWYTLNLATGERVPARDYHIYEEEPLEKGNIRFYDVYSNQLSSKDGITFTLKKAQPIFQKYSLGDYRTPIFKANNQYYVFAQFWNGPGGQHTRVLISKDKTNWKETALKNVPRNMYVIQSGKYFIGYNETEMVISSDGLTWKKIK